MTTRCAVVAALVVVLCGCSGDDAGSATTSSTAVVVPGVPPNVALIAAAVTALEADLGVQQYFEINVTRDVVNLFVALNDGTVAQPWLFFDGQLSSREGQPASGKTFSAAAVDFDAAAVLGKVADELPGSSLDAFVVEGGDGGIVRYTVVVTSAQGGQLLVVVGADGTVLSVDPVSG